MCDVHCLDAFYCLFARYHYLQHRLSPPSIPLQVFLFIGIQQQIYLFNFVKDFQENIQVWKKARKTGEALQLLVCHPIIPYYVCTELRLHSFDLNKISVLQVLFQNVENEEEDPSEEIQK